MKRSHNSRQFLLTTLLKRETSMYFSCLLSWKLICTLHTSSTPLDWSDSVSGICSHYDDVTPRGTPSWLHSKQILRLRVLFTAQEYATAVTNFNSQNSRKMTSLIAGRAFPFLFTAK